MTRRAPQVASYTPFQTCRPWFLTPQTDSLEDVQTANHLDLTLLEADTVEMNAQSTSVKTPTPQTRILVIDGQQTMGSGMAALLRDHPKPGLGVEVAHGRDEAVRMISEHTYEACVVEAGAIDRDPQLQRELAVHHSGPLMVATCHEAPGAASLDGMAGRRRIGCQSRTGGAEGSANLERSAHRWSRHCRRSIL